MEELKNSKSKIIRKVYQDAINEVNEVNTITNELNNATICDKNKLIEFVKEINEVLKPLNISFSDLDYHNNIFGYRKSKVLISFSGVSYILYAGRNINNLKFTTDTLFKVERTNKRGYHCSHSFETSQTVHTVDNVIEFMYKDIKKLIKEIVE